MEEKYYTQANWKVKPGNENQFIKTWDRMREAVNEEDRGPLWGSLIQSVEDPTHFVSFAHWPSREAIDSLRTNPETAGLMAELMSLCTEGGPRTYREIFHVDRTAVNV